MAETSVLETVRIVSTAGVLGGKPRIDGTRISVQQVATYHEVAGWPAGEIAEAFGLTLGQVYAALSYYYDHRDEIDAAIRRREALVAEIDAERQSFARGDDIFHAIMTAAAVAAEFSISPRTVRDAIEHGWIEARKSAGTWLIRRADAEARWGKGGA